MFVELVGSSSDGPATALEDPFEVYSQAVLKQMTPYLFAINHGFDVI